MLAMMRILCSMACDIVSGFDLVIDDIYSTFQTADKARKDGGISFRPGDTEKCILKINGEVKEFEGGELVIPAESAVTLTN